jgi:acyl carrier protein
MRANEDVKNILIGTLNLGDRKLMLDAGFILLGNLPELDSMAVINVISAIEDHFGIVFDDEEISAETFETLGSLSAFVEQKLKQ